MTYKDFAQALESSNMIFEGRSTVPDPGMTNTKISQFKDSL